MRVKVRFRYDPATGQVEFFQVDDVSTGPREAGHDETHDRVSAEIAGVVERDARIDEVPPGTAPAPIRRTHATGEAEHERDRSRDG
ncbi:hypothetical protein Sme01_35740 [Sphaerisporangium melleum]|uniref:FtsH ternary system domain-containing protein n=1 Tax=Sphaerisporangium melleum TaxID=321316 RepID=A0A917VLG4_9ACTN|nr:hypothetical protein [Sphaerisporangium melleum]GGK97257.1 hypothetical protein GCM10007964_44390 [Sphaerisporangium melleum]GII71098.1 hypothetical protein Sme01_35740 [Sphaerisporangium melleum]